MFIEKLTLYNFKNYEHVEFYFSPYINLITGKNGSGKTNLLDAVHHLSLARSAFSSSDLQSLKQGMEEFSIISKICIASKSSLYMYSYQLRGKKVLKVDKIEYERISEHIGKLPVVLIAPNDTDIIREGSEERRKFFDAIICQLDQEYLKDLLKYNHNLKQRNALLKTVTQSQELDENLLDFYNSELVKYGIRIYNIRNRFVDRFLPMLQHFYKFISNENEAANLFYSSHIKVADYENQLRSSIAKDVILQRTTVGVHKDDYLFKIDENLLKNFGSQGQQKSFVISLKLAQYQILNNQKGFKPVLLLDDIFDKLDDNRIEKLMQLVNSDFFGQIFITDARTERSKIHFTNLTKELVIFKIENGKQV